LLLLHETKEGAEECSRECNLLRATTANEKKNDLFFLSFR
jgi:hypothetical protein